MNQAAVVDAIRTLRNLLRFKGARGGHRGLRALGDRQEDQDARR